MSVLAEIALSCHKTVGTLVFPFDCWPDPRWFSLRQHLQDVVDFFRCQSILVLLEYSHDKNAAHVLSRTKSANSIRSEEVVTTDKIDNYFEGTFDRDVVIGVLRIATRY